MTNLNWRSTKPKFKQDCILITASWMPLKEGYWEYRFYEILWADWGEGCYWGVYQDGDEWGDIDDLRADYYAIVQPRKPLPKKRAKALAARNN